MIGNIFKLYINNIMKKTFLSLFALIAMGTTAFAGEKPVIAVADVDVLPGETAWASVNLTDGKADTYTAMTLYAQIPMELVPYIDDIGCTVNAAWEGTSFSYNLDPQTGIATIPFASSNVIPGSSVNDLVKVKLKLKATAPLGEYSLTLKNTLFEYNSSDKDYADDVTFKVNVVNFLVLDETSTVAPVAATGVNVKVKRTINANEWSTICLPFAMSEEQVKAAFGNDVELKNFSSWSSETNIDDEIVSINVGFTSVSAIEANHPYVIKVSTAISEFTVDGVDIDPADAEVVVGKGKTKGTFYGNYVAGTEVPEENLFISGNKFYYSTGSTTIKAFRGYFELKDVLDSYYDEAPSRVVFDFGDVTGIQKISAQGQNDRIYYDLSGRRVEKPSKGVFIVNGKKVIIK